MYFIWQYYGKKTDNRGFFFQPQGKKIIKKWAEKKKKSLISVQTKERGKHKAVAL